MSQVDDYLRRLEREFRRLGLDDAAIVEEARDHLIDAVDDGMKRGLLEDDAEREALDRFGAPELIAAHAASERNRMANCLAAALQTIWARKWWILAPTVAAAAATSVLSWYFLPTRYRSETTILVVPQRVEYPSTSGDSAPRVTVTQFSSARERLERINQSVLSRTNLERMIGEFDLRRFERKSTLASDLVERMRRNIAVTLHAPSGVQDGDVAGFTVSFTSSDPRVALQITERLAMLIIDNNLREREVLVKGTSQFLEAQIEEVRARIVASEATLNDQRARSGGRPLSQADLVPYEVLLDRYRALLNRREDSRTAVSLERRQIGEQFRVVDAARLPEQPVGPSRQEVNVAGTMAGLALGLGMIVVRRKSR